MKFVLASLEDLDQIKQMYTKIVQNMYSNDIKIWNEHYPNELFETDILNKSLYLLKDNNIIIGAFTIYKHDNLEEDLMWTNNSSKAFLLNRLGINVDYLHKGYGQKLIKYACKIAKENSAEYLHLLVSDKNIPALSLYEKCNFNKVNGIHEEKISDDFSIYEYGFEMYLM